MQIIFSTSLLHNALALQGSLLYFLGRVNTAAALMFVANDPILDGGRAAPSVPMTVIPETLALNAAKDSDDPLAQLRVLHKTSKMADRGDEQERAKKDAFAKAKKAVRDAAKEAAATALEAENAAATEDTGTCKMVKCDIATP